MTEVYDTVSRIGFAVSAVMLIVTIFLFWKLEIPRILGELTGRTARKAIEELQKTENVYSKNLSHIGKGIHYEELASGKKLGRITEKIFHTTTKIGKTETLQTTEKLMDSQIEDETRLLEEYATIPVSQENVGFQITKNDVYVHDKDMVTEVLKE